MGWLDDDNKNKERHGVGRPEVNPFPSPQVEEDFVARGRKMVGLYYNPDPKLKSNFQFSSQKRMSKGLFWSIIFIYYVDQKGLVDNLQGFLSSVNKNIGREFSCDRTYVSKCVKMLRSLFVTHKLTTSETLSPQRKNAQKKHRVQYQYVVKLFDGLVI